MEHFGWFPVSFPTVDLVREIYLFVRDQTESFTSYVWSLKRRHFQDEVEFSCDRKGGSLPCRLIREEAPPAVSELELTARVKLAPQSWLPVGKSWIKVVNASEFAAGDTLLDKEGTKVHVCEVAVDAIRLDRLVSRCQAAGLEKTWVECNPTKWVPSFFKEWSAFWNRDVEDSGVPVEAQPYLDLVPESPGIELAPLNSRDLCDTVGELKAKSMRGADGWSYMES